MDYGTLESVLELNTLKLRTGRLRIFVENPVGSGTYNLVRRWNNLSCELLPAQASRCVDRTNTNMLHIARRRIIQIHGND